MSEIKITDETRNALREQWHQFIDSTTSMRPQLHAYCRKLTSNVWDAEDLVQETLLRAFGTLSTIDDPIENPRAYILRIATNLWIDQIRRAGVIEYIANKDIELVDDHHSTESLVQIAEAGRALLSSLPPKQLAAILLKDVFDCSLEETAEALQTTVGAAKSLLSRGRKNSARYTLKATSRDVPSMKVVNRFVELFNEEDKTGLLELILDNAVAGNVGTDTEWGYSAHRSKTSWINGSIGGHPEWPVEFRFDSQRVSCETYLGEPIILLFRTRKGAEAMESVIRLTTVGHQISELRSYSFCPELKREIAIFFEVEFRAGRYRYPTPSHGKRFMDQHR